MAVIGLNIFQENKFLRLAVIFLSSIDSSFLPKILKVVSESQYFNYVLFWLHVLSILVFAALASLQVVWFLFC